jgi:chaperone required for assembly of F1-ATPase
MKTLGTLILLGFIAYLIYAAYVDMKQAVEATKIQKKYNVDKFWASQRDFEE